jgi:hypothetical protein
LAQAVKAKGAIRSAARVNFNFIRLSWHRRFNDGHLIAVIFHFNDWNMYPKMTKG